MGHGIVGAAGVSSIMVLHMVLWIIFLIVVIVLIVWAVHRSGCRMHRNLLLEPLKMAYVSGDITEEEFFARKAVLLEK